MKKFDKGLLVAFLVAIGIIVASNVIAAEWVFKPVQCSDSWDVMELMEEREQTPLFAGVGVVRIENDIYNMPYIIFANTEDGSWHVVEYNVEADHVCIVGVGEQLDFDAADWYEEMFKGVQQ